MKMELTEGSETSAYINQTPGNYPKGNLRYSVHGESLKSRRKLSIYLHLVPRLGMSGIIHISTYPYAFMSYTRNPYFTFTQKPKV